jgi:hypothetical protein
MHFKDLRSIAFTIIALMLVSCGTGNSPEIANDPETIAKQIVAEFLSIPLSDVSLVSITAREFKDSSLDCPEPDMSYLQVLTPGHQVSLEADGRRFDVRISGEHGQICRRRKVKTAANNSPTRTEVSELIELARQDLARRLTADVADVRVLEIHPLNTQTAPKGCSLVCDEASAQCGFTIGLQYDERRYEYHVNDEIIEPCPPILAM